MLAHGIHLGQGTEYAKEMRKWEGHHSQYGPPGRPYQHENYPVALSRASRPVGGGPVQFETLQDHEKRIRDMERIRFST